MRDIRSHLAGLYGVQVSPDLISKVTDAVTDELDAWQNRPLDPVWPIIYIDALWVKIRSGSVSSRPVYLAVGVDMDGCKDVLGLWAGDEGEGATTWMTVLSELRNRGVEDVCIVACDGLKGLPAVRFGSGVRARFGAFEPNPDEYHDSYPGSDRPGLDDNTYTNVTAAWVLTRTLSAAPSRVAPRRAVPPDPAGRR